MYAESGEKGPPFDGNIITDSPDNGRKADPLEVNLLKEDQNGVNASYYNRPPTFKNRTFSKVRAGSIRGSIFSLCACAIGSGVLALPYVFRLSGYVLGIIFILIGAVAAVWSLKIIAYVAVENNINSFSVMANKAGGAVLEKSLSWMIILYYLGSCIGYQIMITSLLKYFLQQTGVKGDIVDPKSMLLGVYQAIPLSLFILFPMSLLRDMSAFRYISLASIFSLSYMGIVLIIDLPSYYSYFVKIAPHSPAYFDWNIPVSGAMCFFAFTCQTQLLSIYSELLNPGYRRIGKVINRAIAIDFFFYATISIAGYLS